MRKGAIELSLGFIVTVVFAVILLSLAIVWLRGYMENVTGLTESQISSAKAELDKIFSTQQTVFALSRMEINRPPAVRGQYYPIAVGFKNNLDSSKQDNTGKAYFAVQVEAIGGPDMNSLSQYQGWINCVPPSIPIQKGDIVGKIMCSFSAPQQADVGTYSYQFIACTSTVSISDNCASEEMFGGAPLILQIVVQ